jgi:predicted nuclease of restriction endonuclease-like RecB superfamily
MLTVDLVRARQQGGELVLTQLRDRTRSKALELAEAFLDVARSLVDATRGEHDERCDLIVVGPQERKLAAGIRKLVEDRCVFEGEASGDARALRREVFVLASETRRRLGPGERLDRGGVLAHVAAGRGLDESQDDLERALYADLRQAQRLVAAASISPEALVDSYDLAQAQAVLLRATRVTAEVSCSLASTYRDLFRQLKFRRLLYTLRRGTRFPGGYRVEIDGPHSLFSSVTKYGLQLALVLPALQRCDRWAIEAHLLWGKDKRPLTFRLAGTAQDPGAAQDDVTQHLPDDVAALLEQLRLADTGWKIAPATEVLEVPGLGLCVPDLRADHGPTGRTAYVEVLGAWSRDAVWKRVELVRAGLPNRVLFAAPRRLRVSESVLDEDLPGELYVYRGKMSAKVVLERLEAMVSKG